MKRSFLTSMISSIVLMANAALAQDTVDCSVALSDNAIDRTSVAVAEDLLLKLKTDICSRDFESASAASSYARSGGAKLNVPSFFDFSLTDQKQRENASWSVKDTVFCDQSSSELSNKVTNQYRASSARFALEAFNKCVEAQSSGLFMSYGIIEDGALMTAKLTKRVTNNGGALTYKVFPVSVDSQNDDTSVTCSLSGQGTQANLSEGSAKTITIAKANLNCVKNGDGFAAITIPTSESDFTIVMPSRTASENKEYDELNSKVDAGLALLSSQIDEIKGELAAFRESSEPQIAGLVERVNFINGLLPDIITYGSNIHLRSNEAGATSYYIYSNHGQNKDPNDVLLTGRAGGNTTWTVER